MNPRILLYVAIVVAVVSYVHRANEPQDLPMVKADYPVCVTMKTGTIEPRSGDNPYPRRKDVA